MDVRRFNLRRAAEERQKAANAASEEARLGHLQIAEIFERRADERRAGRRAAELSLPRGRDRTRPV